ncbi:MAG: periplasmic protein TonB [Acidobacteriota bacterium]|jgi:TonB family protein|nr:periplasmic protein TonB [Acidobacteriota bacterium]
MQRLTIYLSVLILSLLGLAKVSYPSPLIQNEQKWERYTGKGESFSISFPERPVATIMYRPARFLDFRKGENHRGTLYSAYSDGVAYLLYSFPRHSESLRQLADDFLDRYSTAINVVSSRDMTTGGFAGERYLIKFSDVDGVLDFYVTDNRGYILQVIGGDESNPSVRRFLESFTLGKAAGNDKTSDSAAIEIKPESNKSSQANSAQDSGPVFTQKEVTRKAVIVLRREAQYTEEAREARVSGTVVIKAVLSASGEVTNIEATKPLSHGLTEKAIEATRQIIFIPAIKDGKFVSQNIHVEYNFSVY